MHTPQLTPASDQTRATATARLSSDDPTEQLTSRLGRLQIAEDGRLRYYGATSNLHMIRNGLSSCVRPNIRSTFIHGESALARAGFHWESNPEYEEHLTNLFFAWHNSFLGAVDRDVYEQQREVYLSGQTTSYFSPTLENAM
jgi:hypothetical protein